MTPPMIDPIMLVDDVELEGCVVAKVVDVVAELVDEVSADPVAIGPPTALDLASSPAEKVKLELCSVEDALVL
jgi:hypothetical protein